jgi:choline dehydrogenase-like flavoprotein
VVVCANGAETPRLLLLSENGRHPNGLANSSGMVGRNLVLNGGKLVLGLHPQEINAWKGVVASRVVWDWHELDPQKTGLYGGGAIDGRHPGMGLPLMMAGMRPPGEPIWGLQWKRELDDWNNRGLVAYGHTSTMPFADNRIDLDPELKDAWGVPAVRMTHQDDPRDFALMDFFVKRCTEILEAAGVQKLWTAPYFNYPAPHLLGTARMGHDPATSVIDADHRTHDVKNLFLCDGSSLVTGGRGQPTMTIMALAFRAGERIAALAKRGEA